MTSIVTYEGNLRTTAIHLASQTQIVTDAPVDNNGRGERFSPSDLVATALASCMLTIMGIACNTHHINIEGSTCNVTKIMGVNPRRIVEIVIALNIKGQDTYSNKEKAILENAARTCPVWYSVHEDIKKTITFNW